MLVHPILKSTYHAEIHSENSVFLLNELGEFQALKGSLYVHLIPLLQKKCSLSSILKELENNYSHEDIFYALFRMEKKGFIVEANDDLPANLENFIHLLDLNPKDAQKNLKETKLSISSLDSRINTSLFEEKLEEMSLRVDPDGDINLVITDDYRNKQLFAFHEKAMRSKKPWLLMKPVGAEVWIGPLFVPGENGCYECLLSRIQGNFHWLASFEKEINKGHLLSVPKTNLPTSVSLAFNFVANEIFKYVASGFTHKVLDSLVSYNALNSKFEEHAFVKRPQCSSCGIKPNAQMIKPLELKSVQKKFIQDGGHRICHPEETFNKYKHHISSISGVLSEFKESSIDLKIYHSCTPIVTSNYRFNETPLKPFRIGSAGKGKTAIQSKTSCLCEGLERYCFSYQGDEQTKMGTYTEFKDEAIHPYSVLQYSEAQYQNREHLNKSFHSFTYITSVFDENQEIEWSPIWSLTEQKTKWFPTALAYLNHCPHQEDRALKGDSNGCAAGNNLEEAILQGFFELIERDSVALWWYSNIQRPAVDLNSFKDPYISWLVGHYKREGRSIWVLDLTMDLNIPVFASVSMGEGSEDYTMIGFGAHFDPEIALLRAITEMNQLRASIDDGKSEKGPTNKTLEFLNWCRSLNQQPLLIPDPFSTPTKCQDFKRLDTNDLKEDILMCQKIVEEKGLEMLVLDLTRPDIGLSVVRVVVPGLRHFWNRFAPGRLYDVPYELGLVPKKLTEDELNPIPMLI